jgi:hypothetical protein
MACLAENRFMQESSAQGQQAAAIKWGGKGEWDE